MSIAGILPSAQRARYLELFIAVCVLAIHLLFWVLIPLSGLARHGPITTSMVWLFFGSSLILALTVVMSIVVDNLGLGSAIAVGTAVLTVNVVGISIYTIVNPPDGGGVFVGHIFSSLATVSLVVAVFLRRMVNRLFARVWKQTKQLE